MSDEKSRKADGDLDFGFGSVSRVDGTVDQQATPMQDRTLGDEGDTMLVPPPEQIVRDAGLSAVEPPPPLPVCKATMECQRGPCLHYWAITARFDAQSDHINLGRTRQCIVHDEVLPLAEENVFHCSLWWPASLSFIPDSLRPLLRPKLRAVWEWWLKQRGYNFDWKWWTDDIFEADTPEQRRQIALGVGPATFIHEAKKVEGTGLQKEEGGLQETADGVFWGGK